MRLIKFTECDFAPAIRQNKRNFIDQDFEKKMKKSIENAPDEIRPTMHHNFIELVKSHSAHMLGNVASDHHLSTEQRSFLQEEVGKKLRKFYDNLNLKITCEKIEMLYFADKGARRFFAENWQNFEDHDLITLINEQKMWESGNMDYRLVPWFRRNLRKFDRKLLRNLVEQGLDACEYENLQPLIDANLINFDAENSVNFFKEVLDKISEYKLRELVRGNLKSFEKPILGSLIAEDFFSFEHLGFRTWEKVNIGNLRRLLNQHNCTIVDNIHINSWERINSVDHGLETFIISNLISCDDELLMDRFSHVLGNLELLRTLTDENERRRFSHILTEALWRKLTDEKVKFLVNDFSEFMRGTLARLFGVDLSWIIEPNKICRKLPRQLNVLRSFPGSIQFKYLSPESKYSKGTRLVKTFSVKKKVSEVLDSFFCDDGVIYDRYWYRYLIADHEISGHTVEKAEKYDTAIFVFPREINTQFTLSDFDTAFFNCSEFIFLSDKKVYDRHVNTEFQLNGRPFIEILQYSDSSTNEEIIELIPRFEQQNTLLLAWNVNEKLSQDIEETFAQYEFKRIPGTLQAELFRLQTDNQEINFVILFCGKLEGKTYLSDSILDEMTHLRIKCSYYIVCHNMSSDHIKSVFLSTNKYNFLERKIMSNLSHEPFDITGNIPTIEANIDIKVLILTWNIPLHVSKYIGNNTFQNCTIWSLEEMKFLLEPDYNEVILVCCAPLDNGVITSNLIFYSRYFRIRCNFYLVSNQNCFAQIASVLPTERAFHFSLNFCFFGDSIADQLGKVPVLKRKRVPKVLLVTFNLDKNTALEIDSKFNSYSTKHVDLMPWSSDSLSFTGSEFNKVVVICNKQTIAHSRETISVLYSALTRAKQKAVVFCHKRAESYFHNLLSSASKIDQVFEKIRSCENLGENLPSCLENQYDILEAFKRIIVSKNVAQFNSLQKFVSECTDPDFDWVFDRIQSMLLRCFPWGHEIVHMLNKFLKWRPASSSQVNIFNSPSFFSGIDSTKETRLKLLGRIKLGLRSTHLAFDTLGTTKLKNLALSAIAWDEMVLFDAVFRRLKDILSFDDAFFAELLHHAIVLNEIEYAEKVIETIANRESKIFCLLKRTASFIDDEMFCKLMTSVRIPSNMFLMQNLSEEPFHTLIHYFASTATAQCFTKLLSLLPEKTVKFSAFNLQDDLGRNVLMSAVCNSEIFQMILSRAEQQGDLDVLLSQKDSKGWSCLRHACHADNIDVVQLLVRDYLFNHKDDVDSREVHLMDFVQILRRNHIKNFLSRL